MTTASVEKNSLDLLRLVAAALVLYSHQYALLGLAEPSFFAWSSFGGAGVTVFFFMSGMLVWTSWARDPDAKRFFKRRSLRIFPALWVIVLLTIFVLGPVLTTLPLTKYFQSTDTWRYLTTAVLLPRNVLPGVFELNPYPFAINGSLWTLPVEFLCYITVAVVGSVWQSRGWRSSVLALFAAVMLATYAPLFIGTRFSPHFEMMAVFWWGAVYGYCISMPWAKMPRRKLLITSIALAAATFALTGPRGIERVCILMFAALVVDVARRTELGSKLTGKLGDLSYGIYIYAFPVEQAVVLWNGESGWGFFEILFFSVLFTFTLAYFSWHLVERQALRLKP